MSFYEDRCLHCKEWIEHHPICKKTGESICRLCDDCDATERGLCKWCGEPETEHVTCIHCRARACSDCGCGSGAA